MLRRILVAQLLTVLLDTQGADPSRLMEVFPEEFTPNRRGSDCSHRPPFPSDTASTAWSTASPDLTEAVTYLVDRHLVAIAADGRLVPAAAVEQAETRFSLDERDEGFGPRPLIDWNGGNGLPAVDERFDFDERRLES
jgi:hypothetical protein